MNASRLKEVGIVCSIGALCLGISILLGWSSYATRINQNFYDLYFHRRGPAKAAENILIVAIDDETLAKYGALPLRRDLLAKAIRAVHGGQPKAIAIDLLLTDVATEEADSELAKALGESRPVLAAALGAQSSDRWLLPLPQFAKSASAIGHVHAAPDQDGVSRQVQLAEQADRQRHWSLALESFREFLGEQQVPITETPDRLEVPSGDGRPPAFIPATSASGRSLLINYAGPDETFPRISLTKVLDGSVAASGFADKIVFLGVTAQGTGDRLFTPFSNGVGMAGVEIHANILHTLITGQYLLPAGNTVVALLLLFIVLGTILPLVRLRGVSLTISLIAIALLVLVGPYLLFLNGWVLPSFSLIVPFVVTLLVSGAWQLLATNRRFTESESRRRRSQEQFEMATHEMRTPLTAIQASSELLTRYPLDDAKRKQILGMIFDESQRLGKLVERFLSVERLSAGEMELRRVPVELTEIVSATVERLKPAASRKNIKLVMEPIPASISLKIGVEGDPELLEFAVSNLITNAIKYSPSATSVRIAMETSGQNALVHVSDSGPGMTAEERRRIFDRFYRTEDAKKSGKPGFGLGLGIAREIAVHHGGTLGLESTPGSGSRFTFSVPLATPTSVNHAKK